MPAQLLLHIETSTPICSVALSERGNLVALRELPGNANHASMLAILIKEAMISSKLEFNALDGIVLSAGPGSYTGLRIGAATAKGLCYALSKPLITIDSLQSLAIGMQQKHECKASAYCPTIDARRNEIYYALFDERAVTIFPSANKILDETFLTDQPKDRTILIGGSGAQKCFQALPHRNNLEFDFTTVASAQWMISPATDKLVAEEFADFKTFEPNYIKPAFITAKRKIF